MSSDPELRTRGNLIRSLGRWRDMLPGSFIERVGASAAAPICRCADGKPEHLHPQVLLAAWWEGKLRTIHIPAHLVDEARRQVEQHKRFQRAEEAICQINLRRLLRRKQQSQGLEKG